MKKAYVGAAAGAVAALAIAAANMPGEPVPDHFEISATYTDGQIRIEFRDASGGTSEVSMEIQGMAETFRRTYAGPEFAERVQFGPPRYGWGAHPVIFDIRHDALGSISVKTEIRDAGQPPAPVLLVR